MAVTETEGKPLARPSDHGCLLVSLNLSISICKVGVMLFCPTDPSGLFF